MRFSFHSHSFSNESDFFFFFFNDTATTEIYTLSLHDALPISAGHPRRGRRGAEDASRVPDAGAPSARDDEGRSEEHTSELQSQSNLVCRLLLEKKTRIYTQDLSWFTRQPHHTL